MSPATVARQAASAIGAVLHVERVASGPRSGARRLARIGRFDLDGDRLVVRQE
jgi:pilus assembly protein CpaF